ncbi:MAG TPA: AAA family ATPase [Verrucomicrobiae bacterium]|nr:AAA family ATPase [Verrucomicrobiae bacterium]
MTVIEQAQRYLNAIPSAVSGDGGHNQTFAVAMALIEGFALSPSDARPLMAEYSARCSPAWSEREIEHKLADAERRADPAKRGKLIRNGVRYKMSRAVPPPTARPTAAPTPAKKAPRYEVSDAAELPDPMPDGARQFLRAAFQPSEGIRIAIARTGDEGREIPRDAGVTLSREEWLRKLDAHKGNPNGFLKTSDKNGIFVSVNPMKIGGSKDADVTAFRHALLEFDEISREEQYSIILQSRIPCTAIISSGKKSIHAWVKVDAKDRREFDDRVKALYAHFADYKPDEKNKNPSRFSRLPFCERGAARQELLALNVGCDSFAEWAKESSDDRLPPPIRFSDLLALDTSNDPNCVIGFHDGRTTRYLCRGKSGWLLGPSGIGKSSLILEFAIAWALGFAAYGIECAKPLRSLVVQAENDRYDLAEMVQGVAKAHSLSEFDAEEAFQTVNSNILFRTETRSVGSEFIKRLQRMIEEDKPDIVWIDPLLSFAGISVNDQKEVTIFLREMINPLLETTGVVMIGIHHTGKPKSARETAGWNAIDWAYAGLGSSELVNWARAVMMLKPVTETEFELKMAKRGKRAWAKNPDETFTTSIWLRHASFGIKWEQMLPPDEPEPQEPKEKKATKPQQIASMNSHTLLAGFPTTGEGLSLRECVRRFKTWLGSKECPKRMVGVGDGTIRSAIELMLESEKLTCHEDAYFKGKNA